MEEMYIYALSTRKSTPATPFDPAGSPFALYLICIVAHVRLPEPARSRFPFRPTRHHSDRPFIYSLAAVYAGGGAAALVYPAGGAGSLVDPAG